MNKILTFILLIIFALNNISFCELKNLNLEISPEIYNMSLKTDEEIIKYFESYRYDFEKWEEIKKGKVGYEIYDIQESFKQQKGVCGEGAFILSIIMQLKNRESSVILFHNPDYVHAISSFKIDGVIYYYDTVMSTFVDKPEEDSIHSIEKIETIYYRFLYDNNESRRII